MAASNRDRMPAESLAVRAYLTRPEAENQCSSAQRRGARSHGCDLLLRYATDAGASRRCERQRVRSVSDTGESRMAPLLRVNDLRTSFFTSDGEVRAVDGVTFDIEDGQTVGLVGESGCGKSVTALSIIQLLPKGTGRIVGGEMLYHGKDLAGLREEEMRRIRGNEISMIFQEPMTSLNPVMTIGDQIAETVRLHQRREPPRGARPRDRDARPGQDRRAAASGWQAIRTSSPAASASAS